MKTKNHDDIPQQAHPGSRPIRIGPVTIPNGVCLAPLAGISELPFRQICSDLGAGLVVTELVSARGIRYAKSLEKQLRYLSIEGIIEPTAIQLFGSEPEDFSLALERILQDDKLASVAVIDINMGCPVPKVVKSGSGAALMLEPEKAQQIVKEVKNICAPLGKACTVKMRIGFQAHENVAARFATLLAEAGADAICVHARTRSQMYAGKANWAVLSEVRQALGDPDLGGIPLLANGDIVDGPTAKAVLELSGAAGIMIGRAAMGNPWVFPEVLHYLREGQAYAPPSLAERAAIGRRHSAGLIAQIGEPLACKELRKTLGWYCKGMRDAADLRRTAAQVSAALDIENFWNAFESR